MSDDLREREPKSAQNDFPRKDGNRSDGAGTGTGVTGPAPAGGDPEALASSPAGDKGAPGGLGKTAGGGYGSGSGRDSSGGTGEGEQPAGQDPQTDWLRGADGAPTERG